MNAKNPSQAFASFFPDPKIKQVLEILYQKMTEGNVCLDLDEDGDNQMLVSLRSSPIVGNVGELQPFILDGHRLYLERYFKYEINFLMDIKRLLQQENIDIKVKELEKERPFVQLLFPDFQWQSIAAISAFLHHFQMITGGPGTGKTTTVAHFLCLLFKFNPSAKVMLAAPTGKAAVRLKESMQNIGQKLLNSGITVDETIVDQILKLTPTTIHQMLGFKRDSIYFKHNRSNPLDADVVIIDECSMIDIALFSKTLEAVSDHTQLILLGDRNQLSSVEAGSIFGDLCSSLKVKNTFSMDYLRIFQELNQNITVPIDATQENLNAINNHVVELTHSHRFNDQSGIGKLSKAILYGELDQAMLYFQDIDPFVHIIKEVDESVLLEFADRYKVILEEENIEHALKKLNDFKILCAVKLGNHGVYSMNNMIETYFKRKGLITLDGEFYHNRMIMVTQNQPELSIFNGDVGLIRIIDGQAKACFQNVEGAVNYIIPTMIDRVETAWAMTIHKSQGSEFTEVLVVLPTAENIQILNRELLYTAVTRAKEKVVVVSTPEVLSKALEKKVNRISGIVDRLNQ